ncbi:MAG TPA: hypothetical protein VLZ81_01585, partial [Blastocatellia bacterium]|nr:hypothetical protein [Blastocatellia bacterium]
MEKSSEPSSSRRVSWLSRHKRLTWTVGIVICLIVALLIGAFIFIRSGRLNRIIAAQVQSALADFGVRAEIGSFELSWGPRTAIVRDLKLYDQATGQLLATVDRVKMTVSIPDLYALKLRRQIIFDRLELTNLQGYVELDSKGLSNFQGLHQPPQSAPGRFTFDFSALSISLIGGAIHVSDEPDRVNAEITDLQATVQPIQGTANEKITFKTGAGQVLYEGRMEKIDGLELDGSAGDSGANIDSLFLKTPAAELSVSGHITDWN